MATAIKIKLADFLKILSQTAPESERSTRRDFTQLKLTGFWLTRYQPEKRQRGQPEGQSDSTPRRASGLTRRVKVERAQSIDEEDLRAIQGYLNDKTASRRDLEFHLHMTSKMVLHRLELLKERGIIKHLPGHVYGLVKDTKEDTKEANQCTL